LVDGPRAWHVLVSDGDGEPSATVALPSGSAIATSSTIRRRWALDGEQMHHILDPRTGRPAAPVWRTVTVAAPTAVLANTLSTAAVVRGESAYGWLAGVGVTARFVRASGEVLTTGSWPVEAAA
jgi:thiamine biosynthesis lipoprotein